MIHTYFGLRATPFAPEAIRPLDHQNEILDILRVHSHQGGFCLVLGEPGTGKSVIKNAWTTEDPKTRVCATIGRTLHTYTNTVRLICEAFQIDFDGSDIACERRLIEEAQRLHHNGKHIAVVIDDAHLLDLQHLRKLRLLLAEFPKNHNLVLFGQTEILSRIQLTVNEDIRSRITASMLVRKLAAETIRDFVFEQFDACGLGHDKITDDALALIARSSDGILRNAAHLTLAALIQTVREQKRTCELSHVNAALLQPHWRKYIDLIAAAEQPLT